MNYILPFKNTLHMILHNNKINIIPSDYFQRGDYNIIIVEWQPLAPDVSFVLSGQRLAGKHAA